MLKSVAIQPGQLIKLSSGTYQIESEIGSGGFGTVYKANKDGASYAIKLNRIWELLPDDREDIKKRIKLEFEISNTIFSEHVVHTYSYEEIDENPVLVMDYCPDGSLRKRIGEVFSHEDLVDISVQILCGLNILHTYDIVHRDVKPENILFNKGVALLTDFGISANLKSRMTRTNIMGYALKIFATLSYSPPEQSQKTLAYKQTGPTNDIFSFGVILYEIIMKGALPFGSVEDFQADSRIIEERKLKGNWDKKSLRSHVPADIWLKIISRCLAPNPGDRYQSALEIISDIQNVNPDTPKRETAWTLIVEEGPDIGQQYNLTNLSRNLNKRVLTLGRYDQSGSRKNDISINEESSTFVSTRHATLECTMEDGKTAWHIRDGQWYEKDGLKGWHVSTNGLKVNNTRIDQSGIRLNCNDLIKAGKVLFKIICE